MNTLLLFIQNPDGDGAETPCSGNNPEYEDPGAAFRQSQAESVAQSVDPLNLRTH
jgi:hypothetical protein